MSFTRVETVTRAGHSNRTAANEGDALVRKSVGELQREALRSPHVPFLSDLPIRLLLKNGTTMPADLLTLPLPVEALADSSFR